MAPNLLSNALGMIGAFVGGMLGFVLFGLLLRVNLYGLILPGALVGLGCSLLARHRSLPRGIACGILGLLLGLLAEWYHFPFLGDPSHPAFKQDLAKLGEGSAVHGWAAISDGVRSFGYFLGHIGGLDRGIFAYAMLGLGAVLAFWWGRTPQFGDRLRKPAGATRSAEID